MRQATAAELRKNTAGIIRAPRRMPVAEAVHKYMRVNPYAIRRLSNGI